LRRAEDCPALPGKVTRLTPLAPSCTLLHPLAPDYLTSVIDRQANDWKSAVSSNLNAVVLRVENRPQLIRE